MKILIKTLIVILALLAIVVVGCAALFLVSNRIQYGTFIKAKADISAFRMIKKGMTKDQVVALVGEPNEETGSGIYIWGV